MYGDNTVPQTLPRMYTGILVDSWCVSDAVREGRESAQVGFFCLLDLPLSLVVDSALLPYSGYMQIRHGNFRPRLVPEIYEEGARRRDENRRYLLADCRRRVESGTGDYAFCFEWLNAAGEGPWPATRGEIARLPP